MNENNNEKGHWFNVVTFFLPLWAALSILNNYKSIAKLLEYLQKYNTNFELIQIPWLIVSLLPALFFIVVNIVLPVVLTFLLHKRRNYKACKILSMLVAFGFPWGTVLGIFTFILLRRDSIKSEFIGTSVVVEEADTNN